MRLLLSTIIALTVSLCLFATFKMWGQSQVFIDYQHPFLTTESRPVVFTIPKDNWTLEDLADPSKKNLYLNFGVTQDEITVILRKPIHQVRTKLFADIQADVYTADQIKSALQNKKIIFNVLENPIGGPEFFVEFIEKIGFQEARNFLVLSPFEAPMKYLKERQPAYLYGTTQPEILRIKALESIWLIEASTFRADMVVHPEYYYKREFFTDKLRTELQRRFRPFIVGPIPSENLATAKDLWTSKNAFALIVND